MTHIFLSHAQHVQVLVPPVILAQVFRCWEECVTTLHMTWCESSQGRMSSWQISGSTLPIFPSMSITQDSDYASFIATRLTTSSLCWFTRSSKSTAHVLEIEFDVCPNYRTWPCSLICINIQEHKNAGKYVVHLYLKPRPRLRDSQFHPPTQVCICICVYMSMASMPNRRITTIYHNLEMRHS